MHGHVLVNFRKLDSDEVIVYEMKAEQHQVIDIPPGYVHNVKNIGKDDFVMLVWACEVYDRDRPDTFRGQV